MEWKAYLDGGVNKLVAENCYLESQLKGQMWTAHDSTFRYSDSWKFLSSWGIFSCVKIAFSW